jgi:hypothetical protein
MKRFLSSCVAVAVAVLALSGAWPRTAAAAELTADDLVAAYVSSGFAVSRVSPWADGVQMLAISDPLAAEQAGWPTLRVLVFTDADAAALYRYSRSSDARSAMPQLLAGYGPSTWHDNVALVQASTDPATFPAEPECVPDPVFSDAQPEVRSSLASGTPVESRFLAVLQAFQAQPAMDASSASPSR